jgi:hypothetical protein
MTADRAERVALLLDAELTRMAQRGMAESVSGVFGHEERAALAAGVAALRLLREVCQLDQLSQHYQKLYRNRQSEDAIEAWAAYTDQWDICMARVAALLQAGTPEGET